MSDTQAPSKELITAPENPTVEDLIAFYGDSNFRSGVTVRVPYRATRQALEDLQERVNDLLAQLAEKVIGDGSDAPQFFRNEDGDIDFGPVATPEPPAPASKELFEAWLNAPATGPAVSPDNPYPDWQTRHLYEAWCAAWSARSAPEPPAVPFAGVSAGVNYEALANATHPERMYGGDSTEHYYAEMEAARNAAESAYFDARPLIEREGTPVTTFRAGFERAFQKLWNERAAQPPGVDALGSVTDPDARIRELLQSYFWPTTLKPNTRYARLQDDHDGKHEGWLSITIGEDGDAWVCLDADARFRMPGHGGGASQYTRTALVILAEAIRRDNAEHPRRSVPTKGEG